MGTFSQDCLSGKTILITGGLGAIGKAVVTQLLAHAARVAVNDLVPEEEARRQIAESGWPLDRCRYVRADVTKPDQARSLVATTVDSFGGLDVALCHAGIVISGPVLEYSEKDWDKVMAVNLKGAFLVAQAAARTMLQQGTKGNIVFTSSWVQDVPWPEITLYTASKSGMNMLMRGMARELAPKGIRVNAVAPGIVAVGMAKRQWDTEPDYRRRAEKAIPLGFMQPPESVADAFVFLCSDASDYMTGATLLVDGGCSLYPMD
jgi:NAD(P)-dependent dehydrogenase (short-subunit alcohol dehydrogenase family)